MMVINVDVDVAIGKKFPEFADAAGLAGIHQDKAFDVLEIDILNFGEIEKIQTGPDKKIPEIALLGTGEDQDGVGIEFFGRHHGGQPVEISIHVGGNNF